MKMCRFLVAGLVLCVSSYAEEDVIRTISVSGSAEQTVVPDQITISVRVVTRDSNFDHAKEENGKIADSLIKIAIKYGANEKNIKSENFNVRPEYRRCNVSSIATKECDPNEIMSYHIERLYSIVLTDFALYDDFIISAMDAGITHIDSIKFGNTKVEKIKEELQVQAALNARQKASAIVKPLKVELGKPISIVTENYMPTEPIFYGNSNSKTFARQAMDSSAEINTLSIGEMKVKSDIDITFEIE